MSTYYPKGVCAREMQIEVEGNTIKKVNIIGGCRGNSQGIAKLVEGMEIEEVIRRLEGVICGDKKSSCPAQLAQALKEIYVSGSGKSRTE